MMPTPQSPLPTPILFLIFNRPELTFRTFERIRAAKPKRLYIAGDGPRSDHMGEDAAVARARDVAEMVDWDCAVNTLFREDNLGCRRAVSSAIDWAFEFVEELIVIEDDCLPANSFFPYCTELLERYREDSRIFVVSGDNFQHGPPRTSYSYYFSRFNHCWGWATWKRAWKHFDLEMRLWPEIKDGDWLHDFLLDPGVVEYWQNIFDAVYAGKIDTWDYQWTFACWIQNGLTILPTTNLVENIGFGEGATHTAESSISIPSAIELPLPLNHPPFVMRDARADSATQRHHFGVPAKGRWIRHFRNMLFARNP